MSSFHGIKLQQRPVLQLEPSYCVLNRIRNCIFCNENDNKTDNGSKFMNTLSILLVTTLIFPIFAVVSQPTETFVVFDQLICICRLLVGYFYCIVTSKSLQIVTNYS